MLELHTADVPTDYRSLLPFLLQPAIWQQKGSIPGLVKLLKAFLARDAKQMIAAGQVAAVLGIIQQRLIPSKINDVWGMELLQAVMQNIPVWVLLAFCCFPDRALIDLIQCRPATVFPSDHHQPANALTDEQDGPICLPPYIFLVVHHGYQS
jgi:CAS/CSE protein, C-terminus